MTLVPVELSPEARVSSPPLPESLPRTQTLRCRSTTTRWNKFRETVWRVHSAASGKD